MKRTCWYTTNNPLALKRRIDNIHTDIVFKIRTRKTKGSIASKILWSIRITIYKVIFIWILPLYYSFPIGLKDKNPVSRMRFFPKNSTSDVIGSEVKDRVIASSMPTRFEDMAVRVFCRRPEVEATARKAFQVWCKEKLCSTPFQWQGSNAEAVDEGDSRPTQSS